MTTPEIQILHDDQDPIAKNFNALVAEGMPKEEVEACGLAMLRSGER